MKKFAGAFLFQGAGWSGVEVSIPREGRAQGTSKKRVNVPIPGGKMQSHKLKTESRFLHLVICSILKLRILQYLSHKTINLISISAKIAIL